MAQFAGLADVLASRRYWIELSFSPIAIALGVSAIIGGVVESRRGGTV